MTTKEEKIITDRIRWLRVKLNHQRNPESPDCTLNRPLLTGRTEGNIGALEWVLRELREKTA